MTSQLTLRRLLLLAVAALSAIVVVDATQIMHRPDNYKDTIRTFQVESNPKTHIVQKRAENEAYTTTGDTTTTATTTSSSPTSTDPGPGCNGVAAWIPTKVYLSNEAVFYGGHIWLSHWWSLNDIPGGDGVGVWFDQGVCTTTTSSSSSPTSTPDPGPGCNGFPAWDPTIVYLSNQGVFYGGHIWFSKFWSLNDTPGGDEGPWADQGVCSPK